MKGKEGKRKRRKRGGKKMTVRETKMRTEEKMNS